MLPKGGGHEELVCPVTGGRDLNSMCVSCLNVLSYVMMMPFKRQALVEFSAVESADRCVSCGAKEPVYIAGLIPSVLHCEDSLMSLISACVQQAVCVHLYIHLFIRPTGVL